MVTILPNFMKIAVTVDTSQKDSCKSCRQSVNFVVVCGISNSTLVRYVEIGNTVGLTRTFMEIGAPTGDTTNDTTTLSSLEAGSTSNSSVKIVS